MVGACTNCRVSGVPRTHKKTLIHKSFHPLTKVWIWRSIQARRLYACFAAFNFQCSCELSLDSSLSQSLHCTQETAHIPRQPTEHWSDG
eukprot:1462214-Amphidinium_carterae.1